MRFKEFHKQSQPYFRFLKRFKANRGLGNVDGFDLKIAIHNEHARPYVWFIGAVHGDEPAGTEALLKLQIPNDIKVAVLPVAAPKAYNQGTRTGAGNLNLNRQFAKDEPSYEAALLQQMIFGEKPDLVHTFHEDPGANGFYLYYTNKLLQPLCVSILNAAQQYIPIETRKNIYGDKMEAPGRIFVKEGHRAARHKNSLEMWCHNNDIDYICTETPLSLPLEQRVACNVAVAEAVLKGIKG